MTSAFRDKPCSMLKFSNVSEKTAAAIFKVKVTEDDDGNSKSP
jgi:hypothetical protein